MVGIQEGLRVGGENPADLESGKSSDSRSPCLEKLSTRQHLIQHPVKFDCDLTLTVKHQNGIRRSPHDGEFPPLGQPIHARLDTALNIVIHRLHISLVIDPIRIGIEFHRFQQFGADLCRKGNVGGKKL